MTSQQYTRSGRQEQPQDRQDATDDLTLHPSDEEDDDDPNALDSVGNPLYNHPLEPQVLQEYRRLSRNLSLLSYKLSVLSSSTNFTASELQSRAAAGSSSAAATATAVADGLRSLERKTALACTALKSSVYGIVLQQQIEGGTTDEEDGSRDGEADTGAGGDEDTVRMGI